MVRAYSHSPVELFYQHRVQGILPLLKLGAFSREEAAEDREAERHKIHYTIKQKMSSQTSEWASM
jgi:hypothetical protein